MPAAGPLIWPTARVPSSTRSTCWLTSGRHPRRTPGSPPAACSRPGSGCSCWPARGGWDSGDAGSRGWSFPSAGSWWCGCSSPSRPSRSGCPGSSWPSTGSSARPGQRSAGWLAVATASSSWAGTSRRAPTSCSRAEPMRPGGGSPPRVRGLRAGGVWPSPGRPGPCLGIGLAAVQILPLAAYLSRSPVWGDRSRESPPCWAVRPPARARCRLHGVAVRLREPAPRDIPTWRGPSASTT